MRATRDLLSLAAILATLLLLTVPLPAAAQSEEPDDDGFTFHLDQAVLQPFFSDVDTNSSKFEEYRDMRDGATMPTFHLFGESKDGDRTFDFLGQNVLRRDARYTMKYSNAGNYALLVDYNVIPHRFGNDGTQLLTYMGGGTYELADPIQGSLQTTLENQYRTDRTKITYPYLNNLISPYLATASSVDLGLSRKRTKVRLDIGKMGDLGWAVEVNHERRTGDRPYGSAFGFGNVVELPEPIDYDTTSVGLMGEWNASRGGIQFGYRFSQFENDNDALIYDNPFRLTDSTHPSAYQAPGTASVDGAHYALNALSPDNHSNQLFASGRAKIGERGWMNANFSYNQMRQDEALFAYSTNSAIRPGSNPAAPFDVTDLDNLPEAKFDGDVRAVQLNVNGGFKLADRADLNVRYRLYDYNNESGRIDFPGYVRYDGVWEDIERVNAPYEYRRQDLGAEVGFDFARASRIGFGYNRLWYDRTFRDVANSHEDVLRLTVDSRAVKEVVLRGSYEHGWRNIDEYDPLNYTFPEPEEGNLPPFRRFDQAAREYDAGRAWAQFMPADAFDVAFGIYARKDKYDESEFGLLNDRIWEIDADFGWTPRNDLSFYFFGNRSDRESFQRSRQSGSTYSTDPANNWELTLKEVTDTLGLGLNAKFAKRWRTDLMVNWTRGEGDSEFYSPPGGTPDLAYSFPEYDDNELIGFKGELDYAINRIVHAGLLYMYEDFTVDRFAREGIVPYMPASILLAANDGDYIAHVFAFNLNFHF